MTRFEGVRDFAPGGRAAAWRSETAALAAVPSVSLITLGLANVVVANALSLQFGWGGLRTPSPTANLWLTLALLILPALSFVWAQRARRRRGAPEPGVAAAVGTVVLAFPSGCIALAGFVALVWVAGQALVSLGAAPTTVGAAVGWGCWTMPFAALVLAAAVMALRRRARIGSWIVSAACVLPLLLLGVLSLELVSKTYRRADDVTGDAILASVRVGSRRYDALRTTGPWLEPSSVSIMEATPVVPRCLEWSHRVASSHRATDADLDVRGAELRVTFHDTYANEVVAIPLR